jgi:hypothetical protein
MLTPNRAAMPRRRVTNFVELMVEKAGGTAGWVGSIVTAVLPQPDSEPVSQLLRLRYRPTVFHPV